MSENVKISTEFEDNASPGLTKLIGLLDEFIKGVQEGAKAELDASKASEKYNDSQEKTSKTVNTVVAQLAKLAVVFGAIKQGFDLFVQSVQQLDKFDDLSEKTGIAASELRDLGFAAQQSGSSLDGLLTAFNKLSRSAVASEEDVKKQAQAFEAVGVSATNANGEVKNSEELFLELADAFKGIEDGPEKSAAAFRIFGSEAKNLMPLLNKGSEEIKRLKEESKALSLISPKALNDVAAAAGQLKDNIDKVTSVFDSFFALMNSAILPVLNVFLEQIIESAKEGGLLRDVLNGIAKVFKDYLVPTVTVAAIIFNAFTTTVKATAKGIAAVAAAMTMLATGDIKGAKQVMADYKDDLGKLADEHVKFADKLALAGHEAVKLADNVDRPKKKVKVLGKEVKDATKSLEELVKQLAITNASFGQDESAKQRLDAINKYNEAIKAGANPKKAAELRDQALAQIEVNRALRQGAEAEEAYKKAQQPNEELKAQNELLAYENTLVGINADERARLIEKFKEEQALRKATAKLTDEQAASIKEENKGLQEKRDQLLKTAEEVKLTNEILAQSQQVIQDDVTRRLQAAAKLLEAGKITVDDYTKYQNAQMDRLKDKTKETVTEMQEFWKAAAEGIQGDLQSFIFDFAQGKLNDLPGAVKQTLDRIVAQILAAKLATALFGADFAKGNVGGLVGQAGSFLSGLFGGFRAEGGPVSAGKAYVVGEMRPEVFVPTTSGRILPDTSSLMPAGGVSASVTIYTNDAQSFLQQNDRVKRELTQMFMDTARKYNIK